MTRNSSYRLSSLARRRSSVIFLLPFLILLLILAGCGGKSKNSPSNVGGGYTLVASAGTLKDGSGVNGLAVLVTLRDSGGNGPGAAGWQIRITGPGISPPLVVDYDDGSPSSYATWWWQNFNPESGSYTATATNGITTLTFPFSIDAAKTLNQASLNKSGDLIWWNTVSNAGSYYYEVTDGIGTIPVSSGYIASDPLLTQYSFQLPVLTDGSYLVSVYALTGDRLALASDISSSPSLPRQENDSLAVIDFVQGGTGSGYVLDALGGVLYEGSLYSDETGTVDYYGLVIWTSIVTTTTPSTPPANDWNISLSGPGITKPITFVYPRTDSQYIYWDFGTVPAAGIYTVSAIVSSGSTSINQTFTIPDTTSKLPVAAVTAAPTSGGGANVSWNTVTGARSYYVNVWTYIWNATLNQWEYTEIAGSWMKTTSAVIPGGTLTKGISYDIYVTASELDMTDTTAVPPPDPGLQTEMSDTTFTYATITAQ